MTEDQGQPTRLDAPAHDKAHDRDRLLQTAGGFIAVVGVQYAAAVAAKHDAVAMMRAIGAAQRAFVGATQAMMQAAQLTVDLAGDMDTSKPTEAS